MMDVSLRIFPVEVQKRRVQMIDDKSVQLMAVAAN